MFDFETFPLLETPRLRLRAITDADARALLSIRGDPRVTRYNPVPTLRTMAESLDLIDRTRLAYSDKYRIDWAIVLKEHPHAGMVGRIGFNYWLKDEFRSSVGYDIAFAFWRRGIATEALEAVTGFGFESMALRQIDADAYKENKASCRVLVKAGFRQIGVDEEWEFGVLRQRMVYALTIYEWRKMQKAGL